MSHVAVIDLHVKEAHLDALAKACESLGLKLERGRKTWKWYGSWVNDYDAKDAAYKYGIKPEEYGKCAEHVITDPNNSNSYEIGVVRRRDGKPGFQLVYDFYAGGHGMTAKVGDKECSKLKQGYSTYVAVKQLNAKGFNVKVQKGENGHTRVVGTRCIQPSRGRTTFK